MLEPG